MKRIFLPLVYTLTFFLAIGCDITKKRDREVVAKNDPWYLHNYTYLDGNNNKYVFNKNGFEYFPVSAKESSSGTYDGGTYIKKLPVLEQFYTLVDLIKTSGEVRSEHNTNREMGTGWITVRNEKNEIISNWILKLNSAAKQKIEEQLALIKSSN